MIQAAPAFADSNSLVTLGASAGLALRHWDTTGGIAADSLNPELGLRLRLFHWLGAEVEVVPHTIGKGSLEDRIGIRASGLIYLVPTDVVGVYVKAGLGHSNVVKLLDNVGSWESLHVGGGVEVYLGEHLALSGEFYFVNELDNLLERVAHGVATGSLSPATAFDAENFNASLAVRFYL